MRFEISYLELKIFLTGDVHNHKIMGEGSRGMEAKLYKRSGKIVERNKEITVPFFGLNVRISHCHSELF